MELPLFIRALSIRVEVKGASMHFSEGFSRMIYMKFEVSMPLTGLSYSYHFAEACSGLLHLRFSVWVKSIG